MPSIPYGVGAYKRTNGALPPLRLINMYAEAAKTSEQGVTLQSRKGLSEVTTVGSGPIGGLLSDPGAFSGQLFVVSGTSLYSEGDLLGSIVGGGPVQFAWYASELVVCRGSGAYSYDGTDFEAISVPDSLPIVGVCFIGSLFVFAAGGTQKFYWSDPLDGRTIDSLNFASAEREGDNLLDVKSLGDNLVLFGDSTVEVWNHTGDADLPFTRLDQVSFDKGIHSSGCAVNIDNGLMWVGNDSIVYRWGEVPQRVSDHWLEAEIAASDSISVFTFQYEGHPFFCVRTQDATYGFDVATQEWCEFQTYGEDNWLVQCATQYGSEPYFGSSADGKVWSFDGWDDDGVTLERRLSAAQQLDDPLSINRLQMWANAGQTTVLSGQGSDPVVEMRSSDDGGNTWSSWDSAELGAQGEYRTIPEWRALGMFDSPGMMFEFRVTDPVDFRISNVKVNEKGGGRGR
jgi:hypothetical protein